MLVKKWDQGGKDTFAIPVTGSNPPNPLKASDPSPPVPLNCPKVLGICLGDSIGICCCWGRVELGRVGGGASFGVKVVGFRGELG